MTRDKTDCQYYCPFCKEWFGDLSFPWPHLACPKCWKEKDATA